jgi:DNA topoisomerase-3
MRAEVVDIAQALYERHKLISYPRTDSRHLWQDVAGTLPRIVQTVAGPYRELLAPGTGEKPLGPRYVDDVKRCNRPFIRFAKTLRSDTL